MRFMRPPRQTRGERSRRRQAHGFVRSRSAWLSGLFFILSIQQAGAAENCFPRGKSVAFVIPAAIGSADNLYARMIKTVAEGAIGSRFDPKNVPAKGGVEGMTQLYGARPSGRTVGILNAPDAIVAALAGAVPFNLDQFTLFGRLVDSPRAVYVSQSAFNKGIKSIHDAVGRAEQLRWGVTSPSSFFAAAVLNDLFGMGGAFTRIDGSTREAGKAAARGDVDLVVLEVRSPGALTNRDILPLLALGPESPGGPGFQKNDVPMLADAATEPGTEKALALARVTSGGLVIAGPPHIPGIRARCIRAGFHKALNSANLRALATATGKPVTPLDSKAATELIRKAIQDAAPFKTIWVDALRSLRN